MNYKLIVGLGNPTKQYENTRHNIGFMIIDRIIMKLNIDLNETKFDGIFNKYRVSDELTIIFAKPATYMNLSGEFIHKIMNFYKININDLIVLYDDLDSNVAEVKFKSKGSSGGHNGIKNIISLLSTEQFSRIKIGIGKPQYGIVSDYVTSNFSTAEHKIINKSLEKVSEAIIKSNDFDFINISKNFAEINK